MADVEVDEQWDGGVMTGQRHHLPAPTEGMDAGGAGGGGAAAGASAVAGVATAATAATTIPATAAVAFQTKVSFCSTCFLM